MTAGGADGRVPFGPRLVAATLLRAPLFRRPLRYVSRELFKRQGLGTYRLRESGVALTLRHGTPDVYALDQAFRLREFDFPPAVVRTIEALGRAPRVVDLGANIGLFGVYALGRFRDASVVAFEPDPENARVLEQTIRANGADAWTLHKACAAADDGWVSFEAGRFGLSRIEPEAKGISVRALDVFPHLLEVDVLKVDIEGSEWAILSDERFTAVPARALHFEYHAHLCPEPDPRAFATKVLDKAGYAVEEVRHEPPGNGILWAWRPA